ncbi:MAG: CHAT domain-containing tetratricopeptide repeat protein [Bacteroidota bacterium]
MPKRVYILLLATFLIQSSFLFAQNEADTTVANQQFYIGDSLLAGGKYALSNQYFEKASDTFLKYKMWTMYLRSLFKIAENHRRYGNYDQALEVSFSTLNYLDSLADERTVKQIEAAAFNNVGIIYDLQGTFSEALEYYEKALDIRIELYGEDDIDVAVSQNNIGIMYDLLGQYDLALEYHFKALAIRKKKLDKNDPYTASSYKNIAIVYKSMGSFNLALEYYQKAMSIQKTVNGPEHPLVAQLYSSIGSIYYAFKDYEKAREYHERAITINNKTLKSGHHFIGSSYGSIGDTYFEQRSYLTALGYYHRSLDIYKKHLGPTHVLTAGAMSSLAQVQIELDSIDHGLALYEQSLEISKVALGVKHPTVAKRMYEIGNVHQELGDYDKALEKYQQALVANAIDFDGLSFEENPNIDKVFSKITLLKTLYGKSLSLQQLGLANQDIPKLKSSITTLQVCDRLIDNLRWGITNYEDKVQLTEISAQVYKLAVTTCLSAFKANGESSYRELAFYFSEKNRAAILAEASSQLSARNFAQIPHDILALEKKLRADISNVRSQLLKLETQYDSAQQKRYDHLRDRLFESNRQKDSLNLIIANEYPAYNYLKNNNDIKGVSEIQMTLEPHTAVIEYFVGDDALYVFVITNDHYEIYTSDQSSTLTEEIHQFRSMLRSYNSTGADPTTYAQQAYGIFDKYLKRSLNNLDQQITRLIIITDADFGLIPFEALVTDQYGDERTFADLPYLIKQYKISYANSATLLLSSIRQERKINADLEGVLALAPSFKASDAYLALTRDTVRSAVIPLNWTEQEISSISNYFDTNSLVREKADETTFRQLVDQYNIIHLATHGLINDEEPMLSKLLFSVNEEDSVNDGYMHTQELFGMEIPAEMVVLSACNTGYGKVIEGEGILSLARGFFYSGSKSVVMSLWPVNDKSTAAIMDGFYKYLAAGHTKDEALRLAKLDYLSIADETKSHPYFWAQFVANGDTRPVVSNHSNWIYWLVISTLLLVILVAFKKRISKSA